MLAPAYSTAAVHASPVPPHSRPFGQVWVGRAPPLPSDALLTLGVAGILRLGKGSVLAVVTRAKRVRGAAGGKESGRLRW